MPRTRRTYDLLPHRLVWIFVAVAVGLSAVGVPVASAAEARGSLSARVPSGEHAETSLETAAARASSTGRAVAMSLIALAFAVSATVLAFRRDFKEAAGIFAVGIVAVLIASPAGLNLLRATVTSLFGSP